MENEKAPCCRYFIPRGGPLNSPFSIPLKSPKARDFLPGGGRELCWKTVFPAK
jgi:hypothetical protein